MLFLFVLIVTIIIYSKKAVRGLIACQLYIEQSVSTSLIVQQTFTLICSEFIPILYNVCITVLVDCFIDPDFGVLDFFYTNLIYEKMTIKMKNINK